VANNTCSNNDRGIGLRESDSNTVANNTCNSNGIGIYLYYSDSNTVANNTCNNNIDGISLYYSDSNTVVNNTCSSNSYSGIYLNWADSNTVANNTCNNNIDGISLYESDSNTVANNTCNNNNDGIYLYNSDSNTVVKNTCTSNNHFGISLDFSNSNTVVNNTCTSTTENGITLWESISNTVANNTCSSNNDRGIALDFSNFNTVVNNTCNSNGEPGIFLHNSYSNTVANNNHVESAAEAGIHVEESRNNVYTGNWITECRDGFSIVGGDSSNFTFNYIRDNWNIGIAIDHGSNNVFFGNLLDNDENAWDGGTNNQWDDGSNIGNYWGGVSFNDSVSVEGSGNSTDDFPLLIDESDLSLPVIGRTSNTNGQSITEETTMTWVIWSRPGTYTLYRDSEEIESGLWSGSGPFRIQVEIFAPGVHSYELVIDQFDGGVESDLFTVFVPGIEVFLPHITIIASTSIVVIALIMELRKKLRTPTVPAFVSIVKR
jgi:parallel beta-helix repeat protein